MKKFVYLTSVVAVLALTLTGCSALNDALRSALVSPTSAAADAPETEAPTATVAEKTATATPTLAPKTEEPTAAPTVEPTVAPTATPNPTRADELGRFDTIDLQKNPFDYTMFYNYKLTMVNIWATWCGPCVSELPELAQLPDAYKDKGVQFVGLLFDAVKSEKADIDPTAVQMGWDLMQKNNAKYPVLIPDLTLCKLLVTVSAVPTTYFVDSNGKVVDRIEGANSLAGWKAKIDSILAGMK